MNCVIYLRVSTREQAQRGGEKEGYSIPAQREACLKYIQEQGWNFIDEYADRGESARSAARPQLQEMLSRIKKQKDVDVVIVHKIDRLARNMEDHVAIKAVLKRAGAFLDSVTENIENSASGRFMEGIHALMAEYYSANLAAEVKKGMRQKAMSGGLVTRAPIGYKNTREQIQGKAISKVVIDEEMAPLVKEAFQLYSTANYSMTELQKIMARKGLRNKWFKRDVLPEVTKSAIAKMLQNKFYTGAVVFEGVEYPGLHEAIVDTELFDRVQRAIRARDFAGDRKRKHPHYLKGTLFCGQCGSKMSYLVAKNKYPYFYCLGRKKGQGCTQPYAEADKIEREVEKAYKDLEISPKQLKKIKDKMEKELIERENSAVLQRRTLTRKIDDLTNKRHKLIEAYYAEALTIDLMKIEQQRLINETKICEDRIRTLDAKAEKVTEALNLAISLAGNCYKAYKNAKPENRRLFNQSFFEAIYVKDGKLERGELAEFFDALFSADSLNKSSLVGAGGFEPPTSRSRTVRSTRLSHTPKSGW